LRILRKFAFIVFHSLSGQPISGTYIVQLPTFNNTTQENRDLRWERTSAFNLGLDFSFLDGKIEGALDAYRNVTDDLIVTRQLPNVIGFNNVIANLGEIQNQGIEFAVASQNISKEKFQWSTAFNFSLNRNKINELYGDLDENGDELDDIENQRFIGEPTDVIWGREAVGIWQSDEAEEAAVYGVSPGDFKIRDVNNDGLLDVQDNVFQGNRLPLYRWGLTNRFTFFKNIDFSFELYSNWGQKRQFNLAKGRAGFIDRTNFWQTPYWTPENPRDDYARLFSNDGSATFNVWRDASFVRLSNVTLAYKFPKKILEKVSVSNARVYVNARNLGVWARDWDFFDPEPEELLGSGIVPMVRFFTVGLDITL
jgi:hypothetical protein